MCVWYLNMLADVCISDLICGNSVLLMCSVFFAFIIFIVFRYDLISVLNFSEIESNSEHHGGELVAQVLKAHHITHLFTLIGGHISPIVVAAERLGIHVIDTRHEATAVFAADAFARISGIIGVAVVTAGPGVTNTITAMKNAQMAETPLLLLGGAAATLLKGRGALQDIDHISLLKSICKYTRSVSCVRHVIPVLRKAIQIAQSGTPGPVFVELPLDILYPYKLVKQEMKLKKNPKGIVQSLTNIYLKSYLCYQFASAFVPRDTSPLSLYHPVASVSELKKCQVLLSKSKRPLILLGSQAVIPPSSVNNLRKALEILSIPCFLSGMSRGLLGRNSGLHIRQKRKEALQDADLVLLAGSVCDFRLSYGRVLSKKSKIIAVNRNEKQLHMNAGIFWTPTISINASVPDFIMTLSEYVPQNSFENWIDMLHERDDITENKNREKSKERDLVSLNPISLFYELENVLPDNTILIADGGDFVATASYILRARGPLMWLDPGAFGTLGVGAGFALGAKLACPDATVVILYGDGSCGYSVVEFDTFNRHKLPIMAVVGNDGCWTQIAREQVAIFQSDVACNLAFSDYHKIVEVFGGKGIFLSGEDKNCIESKIKAAVQLCMSGTCVLINAVIGKTDFRSGSISV